MEDAKKQSNQPREDEGLVAESNKDASESGEEATKSEYVEMTKPADRKFCNFKQRDLDEPPICTSCIGIREQIADMNTPHAFSAIKMSVQKPPDKKTKENEKKPRTEKQPV